MYVRFFYVIGVFGGWSVVKINLNRSTDDFYVSTSESLALTSHVADSLTQLVEG